jgi:hypothetical protein
MNQQSSMSLHRLRFRHACLAVVLASAACIAQAAPDIAPPAAAQSARVLDLRGQEASADVLEVAGWAFSSGDHQGLPFVVIDKNDSRVFVFDAQGKLLGSSPVLIGSARGDDVIPDIGTRPISKIRPEERTTPAGRYNAVMGKGPKGEDILWVDYEQALALHRVVTNVPKERRLERLQSKRAADRRITYGCINVPFAFFDTTVHPSFAHSRGVVYILPETRPLRAIFNLPPVQDAPARTAALGVTGE